MDAISAVDDVQSAPSVSPSPAPESRADSRPAPEAPSPAPTPSDRYTPSADLADDAQSTHDGPAMGWVNDDTAPRASKDEKASRDDKASKDDKPSDDDKAAKDDKPAKDDKAANSDKAPQGEQPPKDFLSQQRDKWIADGRFDAKGSPEEFAAKYRAQQTDHAQLLNQRVQQAQKRVDGELASRRGYTDNDAYKTASDYSRHMGANVTRLQDLIKDGKFEEADKLGSEMDRLAPHMDQAANDYKHDTPGVGEYASMTAGAAVDTVKHAGSAIVEHPLRAAAVVGAIALAPEAVGAAVLGGAASWTAAKVGYGTSKAAVGYANGDANAVKGSTEWIGSAGGDVAMIGIGHAGAKVLGSAVKGLRGASGAGATGDAAGAAGDAAGAAGDAAGVTGDAAGAAGDAAGAAGTTAAPSAGSAAADAVQTAGTPAAPSAGSAAADAVQTAGTTAADASAAADASQTAGNAAVDASQTAADATAPERAVTAEKPAGVGQPTEQPTVSPTNEWDTPTIPPRRFPAPQSAEAASAKAAEEAMRTGRARGLQKTSTGYKDAEGEPWVMRGNQLERVKDARHNVDAANFPRDPAYATNTRAATEAATDYLKQNPSSASAQEAMGKILDAPVANGQTYRDYLRSLAKGPDGALFGTPRQPGQGTMTPISGKYAAAGATDGETVALRAGRMRNPDGKAIYKVAEPINGRPVELTNVSSREGQPAMWIHPELTASNIKAVNGHVDGLLQKALGAPSTEEATKAVGEMHWWLAQQQPYIRGTASVADALSKAVFDARGETVFPYKRGIVPDVEALVTPLKQYVENYASFFMHPPQ